MSFTLATKLEAVAQKHDGEFRDPKVVAGALHVEHEPAAFLNVLLCPSMLLIKNSAANFVFPMETLIALAIAHEPKLKPVPMVETTDEQPPPNVMRVPFANQ